MEDNTIFSNKLELAISKKLEWYNSTQLPEMLDGYRLLYTCVKNLNDLLIKKSIIIADPYKLDRRISDIGPIDTRPFQDAEAPSTLGARLSEYEMMLDFICTYFRFSLENLTSSRIKTLLDINKSFDWTNLSPNNTQSNTRTLAIAINQAKVNSPAVIISTLADNLEKCKRTVTELNKALLGVTDFQKEKYKSEVRKAVLESPEFDKQKAYSSPENEMAEIKRLYSKLTGKKNFYTDLINEIINEDQGANAQLIREKLLQKFNIQEKEVKKTVTGPDPHFMLMQSVLVLGALDPILSQMRDKISDNFDLLFYEKKTFFARLKKLFMDAFGLGKKERIVNIPVTDLKTGAKSVTKINVAEFMADIAKKEKIYDGLGNKGPEYTKISNASDEAILAFVNKQISENQQLFNLINALDDYFKSNVEILLRPKVKGLKIDLSSYRNAVITVNKKRGEYLSFKEEQEQLQNLGINK